MCQVNGSGVVVSIRVRGFRARQGGRGQWVWVEDPLERARLNRRARDEDPARVVRAWRYESMTRCRAEILAEAARCAYDEWLELFDELLGRTRRCGIGMRFISMATAKSFSRCSIGIGFRTTCGAPQNCGLNTRRSASALGQRCPKARRNMRASGRSLRRVLALAGCEVACGGDGRGPWVDSGNCDTDGALGIDAQRLWCRDRRRPGAVRGRLRWRWPLGSVRHGWRASWSTRTCRSAGGCGLFVVADWSVWSSSWGTRRSRRAHSPLGRALKKLAEAAPVRRSAPAARTRVASGARYGRRAGAVTSSLRRVVTVLRCVSRLRRAP